MVGRHHHSSHAHSGPHSEFSRRRRRSRTADTAVQASPEDIINEAERNHKSNNNNKGANNNKAKLYTLLALPFPDQTVGRRYLDAPNCHKWAGYFSEEPSGGP